MKWYKQAQILNDNPSVGIPFNPDDASDLEVYHTELMLPFEKAHDGSIQKGSPQNHTVTVYYQVTSSPHGENEVYYVEPVHVVLHNTDIINSISQIQKNKIVNQIEDAIRSEPDSPSDNDLFDSDEAKEWGGINFP